MNFRPTAALLAIAPAFGGEATSLASLEWRPTTTASELGLPPLNLLTFEGVRVSVPPFADGRADKQRIAENQERRPTRVMITNDDVPAFVHKQTLKFLSDLGLPLAPKGSEGTVTLSAELLDFFVLERTTYVGNVRLKVTVRKGDKALWMGMAVGSSKRFGRSFSLENYHETLSDSVLEALSSLFKDGAFLKALADKGTPAT
jgi:hypothetical protein